MVMPVVGVVDQGGPKVEHYVDRVEASGGRAVILYWKERRDPTNDATAFDGLVLCGGDDVPGHYFGQPTHPKATLDDADRDAYEIDLVRHVVRAGVPLLAICRGMQVLNVALGGDLEQHLPDVPGRTDHTRGVHELQIAPNSLVERLSRSNGCHEPVVNSHHHQAVGRIARGLAASARSQDGAVEAVEGIQGRFCLGVQWHPERDGNTEALGAGLFDALVVAALTG